MEWRVFRYWLYWKWLDLRIWAACKWLNLTKHRVRIYEFFPGAWAEIHAVHKDLRRWGQVLGHLSDKRDKVCLRYIDEKYRR